MEPEVFCAISDGPGSNRAVTMTMTEIFPRTTSLPLFAAEFIAAHSDWKPFSMRLKESRVAPFIDAHSLGIRNRPRGRAAARLQVAQDCQRIPVHAQDIAAPVLASFVVEVKLRSFPVRSGLQAVDVTGRGDGCIVIES